jgi:hypothetical protein
MVTFKPLNECPKLEEFKRHFKIDDNAIIAYDKCIYTNRELPEDMVIHEKTHLFQQKEYGLDSFIERYIEDKDFRLKMERQAFLKQLRSIKDRGLRKAVKLDCIDALTSGLYGDITREEAIELLK